MDRLSNTKNENTALHLAGPFIFSIFAGDDQIHFNNTVSCTFLRVICPETGYYKTANYKAMASLIRFLGGGTYFI
jgi:hypothetical protein